MPEEINRVLTDRLSDLLLTHSPEAEENLARGGHRHRPRPLRRQHDDRLAAPLRGAPRASRAVWTRHGVDRARLRARHAAPARRTSTSPRRLAGDRRRALPRSRDQAPVVFPVHPRTRARLAAGARRSSASRPPASAAPSRSATSTSCRSRPAPARSSPTRAASRRRPSALGVPCFTLRAEHRAARHDQPRHERAARRRPGEPAAASGCSRAAADAVRDPAVGRPRRASAPPTRIARRVPGRRAATSGGGAHEPARRRPRLRDRPPRHAATRSRGRARDRRRAVTRSTWRSTRPSSSTMHDDDRSCARSSTAAGSSTPTARASSGRRGCSATRCPSASPAST